METVRINGALFAALIRAGAVNLEEHRQTVNDLNVFPIPDGDTGDNMFMTIDSGVSELSDQDITSLCEAAATAAKGMLLGARGNSGVILSRIFAGIAHGLDGVEEADIDTLCKAMKAGVDEAYHAVSVPVEGTILTVYKDAVNYAASRVTGDSTLSTLYDDFMGELRRSLDRTPDLLDILKESGVVDSGGAGILYIAEGMRSAVDGKDAGNARPAAGTPAHRKTDLSRFTEDSVLDFGYCTEFLLRLQTSKVDLGSFDISVIKDYLESVGDSVVIFRDGSIVKAHVHTMRPGDILNKCQEYGEYLTLKIENMTLQHNEQLENDNFAGQKRKPHKKYGLVAVAAGKGITDMFTSLGCDAVIEGGQSMNPSAQDFVRAFESMNADTIFVFPNNGNVILTAQQAAGLYGKADIRIINSRSIGEGYAAISNIDLTYESADDITAEMEELISGVVTGTVSVASRTTTVNGRSVTEGEYIGFSGDTILSSSEDRNGAAEGLAEAIRLGSYDIALIICGSGPSPDEAQALKDSLSKRYPRTEVIVIDGGQPVYDYIMVLE